MDLVAHSSLKPLLVYSDIVGIELELATCRLDRSWTIRLHRSPSARTRNTEFVTCSCVTSSQDASGLAGRSHSIDQFESIRYLRRLFPFVLSQVLQYISILTAGGVLGQRAMHGGWVVRF